MKSTVTRSAAALALSLTLGVGVPAAAFASGNSPTTTHSKANSAELKAYGTAMLNINKAYQAAVAAARTTFKAALTVSTNSTQRDAAQTAFKAALTSAMTARDAAKAALGTRPVASTSATVTLSLENKAYGASVLAINSTFKSTVSAARATF